jgi:hypothetical protein
MLILALALAGALQASPPPQDDRDELRRLQREAIAAHERKDVAAFLAAASSSLSGRMRTSPRCASCRPSSRSSRR